MYLISLLFGGEILKKEKHEGGTVEFTEAKKDELRSEGMIELASLLKANGYNLHLLQEQGIIYDKGQIGLLYFVKVSKYFASEDR